MKNFNISAHLELLDEEKRTRLSMAIANYRERFRELVSTTDIQKIKTKASQIRIDDLKNATKLWDTAKERLEANGVKVHFTRDNAEAVAIVDRLVKGRKKIVKSKSNLIEELGLASGLRKRIVETDVGDWVVREMGEVRIHPNAPAMGLAAGDIAAFLNKKFALKVETTAEAVTREICRMIREAILKAQVGLSGVNFVTSEGHILIVENEGNISLLTRMPEVHIAVVAYHRIVKSLEDAVYLCKCLAMFGTGKSATAYVNIISSPSCTTDIEKKVVSGAQGAKEVHLIVVDNNRRRLLADKNLGKALKCIGCGGCMMYCPISEIAGANYGGTHQGGIGLVLSHFICHEKVGIRNGVFACLGCEMCEEICPVDAKIWDNIKDIRGSLETDTGRDIVNEVLARGSFSYGGKD